MMEPFEGAPAAGTSSPGRTVTRDGAAGLDAQDESSGRWSGHWVRSRAALVALGLAAAMVLSGCTTAARSPDAGMMGGNGSGTGMGATPGSPRAQLSCTAPASLPGPTVSVSLTDMGMVDSPMMGGAAPMGERMGLHASPSSVRAGKISFVASNFGGRTHELVILPLAAGASAGKRVPGRDGRVDEAGSLGEASASCAAGSGEGVTSGSVGWVTVTLPAGRYELVCNLQNHYADGMYQELDVT